MMYVDPSIKLMDLKRCLLDTDIAVLSLFK
jgi:hypothetical protein